MSFGSQLKKARKSLGMTQKQLADLIHAKHNSISNWENDQNMPDPDTIAAICGVLHISPNYLITENTIPEGFQPMPDMYSIPLLDSKIACGEPILCDSNIAGQVQVPIFIKADLALICQGYSMTGDRIMDGDMVCIHRQPVVEDGEIAAVRIRDESTLKHVYYNKEHNELRLKASNPAYPDQVYIDSDLDEIEIIGRAVAFVSKIQ